MIMKYIEKKARKNGATNGAVENIFKCILSCFEKCLKFINRNAFIEVAIYGTNFCSGVRKAFMALENNKLKMVALNSVSTFILFLGKLAVVFATVFCGILIMHTRPSIDQPVKNGWAPILLSAIFAYVTIHCFISVYEMAIDTIFICFCEEDSDNNIKKPHHMKVGLMDVNAKSLENLRQSYKINFVFKKSELEFRS